MSRESVEKKIWKALDGTNRSDYEKQQIVVNLYILANIVNDEFLEEKAYNIDKLKKGQICQKQ